MAYDIEKLYQEHAKAIYRFLMCLTNDSELAEDLTQETFYQAARGIDKFRGNCKISVWLCQIAKFLYYKHARKQKIKEIPLEDLQDYWKDDNNIEKNIIDKISLEEAFKQINNLDNTTKEIIILRVKGGLSFKEIGDIFNQTENWARVTFYRGKQKLKEAKIYEE